MNSTCGVVNSDAFCLGARRVPKALATGRVDPHRPALTTHPVSPSGRGVTEAAAQLHRLHDAAAVMRAHPDYAAPQARVDAISRRCWIPVGSRCWNRPRESLRSVEQFGDLRVAVTWRCFTHAG